MFNKKVKLLLSSLKISENVTSDFIWYTLWFHYDMPHVLNERKNCFVLLDNNAEKSKKQITPVTFPFKL